MLGKEFGRCNAAFHLGQIIEVAIVEWSERFLEALHGPPDVHDNAIDVQALSNEGHVDYKRRSVQRLRGAEYGAPQ